MSAIEKWDSHKRRRPTQQCRKEYKKYREKKRKISSLSDESSKDEIMKLTLGKLEMKVFLSQKFYFQ